MNPIKVVIYGVGSIGSLIARLLIEKGYDVIGGIDIDASKVGKDLGLVVGLGREIGSPIVHESISSRFLHESRPDVVVVSTSSFLDKIYPQIARAIQAGCNVVSTAETLVYPWYRYPELAYLIDEAAKKKGARVLGTGVNPGFIMDVVPAVLSMSLTKVRKIRVVRSIDASKRRYAFQKKIGLSLTPEDFKSKMNTGEITGHVGYAESTLLLAHMLGLRLDRVEEGQEPIIAMKQLSTGYFEIKPGHVMGIHGWGSGYLGSDEIIKLELYAGVGYEDYDEIRIEGEYSITWRSSGVPGDIATAALVVNVIPRFLKLPPGLLTMRDLVTPT